MNLAESIYQHSLNLPENAAREVLDFIEFLEQREVLVKISWLGVNILFDLCIECSLSLKLE